MTNLDKVVDRHNTNSLKWDFAEKRGKNKDILPLWVADMDFELPDIIIDKLKEVLNNKIFGYSEPLDGYYDSIIEWNKKHYNLDIDKKYIINGCSVVFQIATIIKALTNIGDGIIINEPVYYPFKETILANDRNVVISNLINDQNNKYTFNYDDIEEKIINNNVKIYLLCNPHNPVSRAWKKEELEKIVNICNKHNVFIVSDEIHADFVYNNQFISIGLVANNNYAILTAPTKTFNIPGLHTSYAYIPNDKALNLFKKELVRTGYSQSNVIGIKALEIVYKYGNSWYLDVKNYIYENYLFLKKYLEDNLKVKITELEATYLVWIDFNSYNLKPLELKKIIEQKANLWVDQGYIFGNKGNGFIRINIATQRSFLKKALDNLINAFKDL